MEAFAMFASDLDPASRAQLARGARLVELLKQPQASPYPVEEQVVSIWTGTTGQLDDIAVEDVRRFESEFLDYLRRERSGLLEAIRESKKLDGRDPLGPRGRRRRRSRRSSAPAARRTSRSATRSPTPSATRTSSRSRSSSSGADPAAGCATGDRDAPGAGQRQASTRRTGRLHRQPQDLRHDTRRGGKLWERRCGSTASASGPSRRPRRSPTRWSSSRRRGSSRPASGSRRPRRTPAPSPAPSRPWRRTPTSTTR